MKRREPPFVSRGRLGVGVLPPAPGRDGTGLNPWRHDDSDPVRRPCPPPIVSSFASRHGREHGGNPRRSLGWRHVAPIPAADER
ncbi:MAG TPA: hypothetical protein VKE73_03485 [Myxococcota bacterium]|nr:hypothetical protein [Myxococcota bacterium]